MPLKRSTIDIDFGKKSIFDYNSLKANNECFNFVCNERSVSIMSHQLFNQLRTNKPCQLCMK